jgi:hypothetical protein
LDVWPKTLRRLVTLGAIECVENIYDGQFLSRHLIRLADIEAFNEKFVSVRGLSKSSGLSAGKISSRIKSLQIDLAFPPAGVNAWFIPREDIAIVLADEQALQPHQGTGTGLRLSQSVGKVFASLAS